MEPLIVLEYADCCKRMENEGREPTSPKIEKVKGSNPIHYVKRFYRKEKKTIQVMISLYNVYLMAYYYFYYIFSVPLPPSESV